MPEEINLQPPNGMFAGLAKNNMDCGHCICELVDNAVAANQENYKIQLHLEQHPGIEQQVIVHILDNSGGMTLEMLKNALPIGSSPGENQLNEHGYGMKNALATLSSKNTLEWELKTRTEDGVSSVSGPFRIPLHIYSTSIGDHTQFDAEDWMIYPDERSTYIRANVTKRFFNTLKGWDGLATNIDTLKYYLIEEMAMKYSKFLQQQEAGEIWVTHLGNQHKVLPLIPPIGGPTKELSAIITLPNGQEHELNFRYQHGALDRVLRDESVKYISNGVEESNRPKRYHQGVYKTQGFSIALGNRTIVSSRFDNIWETGRDAEGDPEYLKRHNQYNDYLGELFIPEFPPGSLTTVNNKRGLDPEDQNWPKVFQAIAADNETKPTGNGNANHNERYYEEQLVERWLATPGCEYASRQDTTFAPAGVRMDVYVRMEAGEIYVYELKVTTVTLLDAYQLKMYWDGLVLGNINPTTAYLVGHRFIPQMPQLINEINGMTDPQGNPYRFETKTLTDPAAQGGLGLRD